MRVLPFTFIFGHNLNIVRIHLVVNLHRADAIEAAGKVYRSLQSKGVDFGAELDAAAHLPIPSVKPEDIGDCDLIISFGGDGTLIRAAHLCVCRSTPILGVYYGRFGFVTQCHPNEIGAAISSFLDKQAKIEERMMIQSTLIRNGKPIATLHSLNEAVVQRAATTRMLEFEITVDGQFLTSYPADGVVVSTPTGSTAYNLSAGGPIVSPQIQALILSAIAPHTLSSRALVLDPSSVIKVKMETRGDAILSFDGQSRLSMVSGDHVEISKSDRTVRLVTIDSLDFITKLSDRILWTRGGINT